MNNLSNNMNSNSILTYSARLCAVIEEEIQKASLQNPSAEQVYALICNAYVERGEEIFDSDNPADVMVHAFVMLDVEENRS